MTMNSLYLDFIWELIDDVFEMWYDPQASHGRNSEAVARTPLWNKKSQYTFLFVRFVFCSWFLFSGWYVSSFLHFPFSYPRKRKICFIISKYSHMVSPVVFSWWLKEVLTVLNSLTLSLLCLLHFKLYGYALLLILCVISTGWVLK